MPYKSDAQRKKFHVLEAEGKIPASTVSEWDSATGSKKLPEHVKKRKGKGMQGSK